MRLEERYYELSKFRWPRGSQSGNDEKINACLSEDKSLPLSVAEVIISGADELLPPQRVLTRYKGLFEDVGDALFLYIQPSIALLDAQTGQATMLDRVPPKILSILEARRQLYEGLRRFNEDEDWVQSELDAWEMGGKQTSMAIEEWWRLERTTFNQLIAEKDNPLKFVDQYTVARARFLTRSDIPQIKVHALERGRHRFHQDLRDGSARIH